uniref:Uncharacterized protein n=1 Tax=Anguilla anguilla TaxID=7936 RepID=A0A0E9WTD4_ANGAN
MKSNSRAHAKNKSQKFRQKAKKKKGICVYSSGQGDCLREHFGQFYRKINPNGNRLKTASPPRW